MNVPVIGDGLFEGGNIKLNRPPFGTSAYQVDAAPDPGAWTPQPEIFSTGDTTEFPVPSNLTTRGFFRIFQKL